jgi:hypothetical protein
MAVLIGRVTEHDLSNITVGGKLFFVPPEKRNAAWLNFPSGSVAKVTHEKGTVKSIVPPSPEEMAAFTRTELEQPAVKPVTRTMQATEPAPKKSLLNSLIDDVIACKIDADGSVDCILRTGDMPTGYSRVRDLDVPTERKIKIVSSQLMSLFGEAFNWSKFS